MYPINGIPFVEYSLKNILSCKMATEDTLLTFVVGYKPEQIMNYFGNRYNGLKISYVFQEKALGTGNAVKIAYKNESYKSDSYLFWLGDTLLNKDHLEKILHSKEKNIQSISKNTNSDKQFERVDIMNNRIIKAYNGSSPFVDIGITKLSSSAIKYIGRKKTNEYRYLLDLQSIIDTHGNVNYIEDNNWIHLGDIQPSFEENIKEVTRKLGGF